MDYDYQNDNKYQDGVGISLEKTLRVNFTKKVFSIVAIQLLMTTLVVFCTMQSEKFALVAEILYIPSIIALIITGVWLGISRSACRQFPKNYILLTTFTLSEAIGLAITCLSVGDQQIVFQAFLLTTGVVIALTVYALLTKDDFSFTGGILCLLSFSSLMCGIWFLFFRNEIAYLAYLILGAIIFGIYLIYDIQIIVGDKQLSLRVDDYILGAMMLYVDIIKLFIRILKILEKYNDKKKK